MASFFSTALQGMQTMMGKSVVTASEAGITKRPKPTQLYEEWRCKAIASKKHQEASFHIRSLWHEKCHFCQHYLLKTVLQVDEEILRLCLENYETAFYALKEGFDEIDEEGSWSSKFPFLLFGDNMDVTRQLREHWVQMYPAIPFTTIADDLKFLESIDPLFQQASRSTEYDPTVVSHYDRAIKALANIAETMGKRLTAEMIRVLSDDRVFTPEANQQFTVMCWGEPVYAFLGGPLSDKQIKYMKVACRIAHVPERDAERLRFTRRVQL